MSLKRMKKEYDSIPIPKELSVRVAGEIAKSRQKNHASANMVVKSLRKQNMFVRSLRTLGAAAAAAAIVFTLALNTFPAFALEAAQLPVIGSIARVMTFRSYQMERNEIGVSVEVPSIEMIEKDTGVQADAINQEILNCCNQYVEEALTRAEEYRDAFLATGGTPEEWAAHNIKITVNYEILQQDEDYLSFVIRGFQNWSSAGNETRYYNLDLHTGAEVTLKDLLGDDYESLVNDSIRQQIAEREKGGAVFFPEDAGGFQGITEDTKFYISDDHNPVIVFDKYEIANGAAGEIRFEVTAEPQTLEALLGGDYRSYLTKVITMQMENRMEKNPEIPYYPVKDNAPLADYVTIGEETLFEVDAEGILIISFPAGTVTEEANGVQSFRIQKVDTN